MVEDSLQSFADDDTLEDPIDISQNATNNNVNNSTINNLDDNEGLTNAFENENLMRNHGNVLTEDLTSPRSYTSQSTYKRQQSFSTGNIDFTTADRRIDNLNTIILTEQQDFANNHSHDIMDNEYNMTDNESSKNKSAKPNFTLGTETFNAPHSTIVRKLTDAINNTNSENTDLEGGSKFRTQFTLKRTTSPINMTSGSNHASETRNITNNHKLSQPFPLQRVVSDINNDAFRLPAAKSLLKLNSTLPTSTPTISHSISKEDMSNDHLHMKKSIQSISINNGTDDSVGESANINIKIKKNQTTVKLPSESQIINSSIQTPRPKIIPSKNKTDFFAAKLADATNEKTSKEDDQEENFVYEDLMLDQDKVQSKKGITKSKHQSDEKEDERMKTQQVNENLTSNQTLKTGTSDAQQASAANTSISSAMNNISQGSNNISLGKNLTNQPSVIIDPSRLLISNKRSINSMSPSNFFENGKVFDKSMSNEVNNGNITLHSLDAPVAFTTASNPNNNEEISGNIKFLNVENTPSNFSSLSNRPSNLMNNRNNLGNVTSQSVYNGQKPEIESIVDLHQTLPPRPSLANLSTTSSNNNLSQYKKMMQNNARHSSMTVGILPVRQQNKSNMLQQDRLEPMNNQTANQSNATSNFVNTNDFYNDMLDYSSPSKKVTGRVFRDKSNRSSMIEELQEDQSDFMIPTTPSFVFESGKNDTSKRTTIHDTLEETELNKKFNSSDVPVLAFENNKSKQSRHNSTIGSPTDQIAFSSKVKRPSFAKQAEIKSTASSLKRFIGKGDDDFIEHEEENTGPFSSNFNNHLKNIMSESTSDWDETSNRNKNAAPSLSTMTAATNEATMHETKKGPQNTNDPRNDIFKSPLGKQFSAFETNSSHHHFGLDDDFDEDDFDERSSFYYHPRKNSQSNMTRIPTVSSSSNNARKMKSQKKAISNNKNIKSLHSSTDDNFLYGNSINAMRLYDQENEQSLRNHFSGTDMKLHHTNKTGDRDDSTTNADNMDDDNFHTVGRDTARNSKNEGAGKNSRHFLWGENEISFDDENEYHPLTSENNRHTYYYDSIHDFSPVKNSNGANNNKKMNLMPQFGNNYYPPHEYYNNGNAFRLNSNYKKRSIWSKIKLFICWLFLFSCLIMLGVGIGAYIVSSKELSEFDIAEMSNSIITQDEILFDITAFAHNPSLFSISIQEVNIDIFAESKYSQDTENTDLAGYSDDDDLLTILLGSVYELETPLLFQSNIFWRYFSISKSSMKLKNPAKSALLSGSSLKKVNKFDELYTESVYFADDKLLSKNFVTNAEKTTVTLNPSDFLPSRSDVSTPTTSETLSKSSVSYSATKTTSSGVSDSFTTTVSAEPSKTPPVPPPRNDKKFKQWKEISKYEFTLIIKGAAYYNVPFIKSQRSVPIQHQIIVNKGKVRKNSGDTFSNSMSA
ncbi:hypothetical protein QEN19_004246 [Hanseniaspora menglaensis]